MTKRRNRADGRAETKKTGTRKRSQARRQRRATRRRRRSIAITPTRVCPKPPSPAPRRPKRKTTRSDRKSTTASRKTPLREIPLRRMQRRARLLKWSRKSTRRTSTFRHLTTSLPYLRQRPLGPVPTATATATPPRRRRLPVRRSPRRPITPPPGSTEGVRLAMHDLRLRGATTRSEGGLPHTHIGTIRPFPRRGAGGGDRGPPSSEDIGTPVPPAIATPLVRLPHEDIRHGPRTDTPDLRTRTATDPGRPRVGGDSPGPRPDATSTRQGPRDGLVARYESIPARQTARSDTIRGRGTPDRPCRQRGVAETRRSPNGTTPGTATDRRCRVGGIATGARVGGGGTSRPLPTRRGGGGGRGRWSPGETWPRRAWRRSSSRRRRRGRRGGERRGARRARWRWRALRRSRSPVGSPRS